MYPKIIFVFIFNSICLFSNAQAAITELSGPSKRQAESIFEIRPNPGSGIYQVVYKSESKVPLMLVISDATGKYIYLKSIKDFNGELKETVDLSINPKGLYFFEIEGDNYRDVKKVIYQ
jgi:hypothetical protein